MELTGKQKRKLRALGHHLRPVGTIGKGGPGESVLAQLEANLLAHELVKVKVLKTCPLPPDDVAAHLTGRTGAAVAQRVGRTLLLYRPHPERPVIEL
jgi:RNA-binding protein